MKGPLPKILTGCGLPSIMYGCDAQREFKVKIDYLGQVVIPLNPECSKQAGGDLVTIVGRREYHSAMTG